MEAADPALGAEIATLQRQVRFYRRLLELGSTIEPETFLRMALVAIIEATGALKGYLQIAEDVDSKADPWWLAHDLSADDLDHIRRSVSQGIIGEALSTGATVVTHSARLDQRFRDRSSVDRNQIDAVLCAPFGSGPSRGVVYLQGSGGGTFCKQDRQAAEDFARFVAPLAQLLLARRRLRSDSDATRVFRERLRIDDLIGRSPALARVLADVVVVAAHDVTVLITGERGTGKTQLARLIRNNGPRATAPFIEVNCANLSVETADNELFGHEREAFTDAKTTRAGVVDSADGGTLFLDEVGDLPLHVQPKLLSLINDGTYRPLGSKVVKRANLRVIAATNKNLADEVAEGRFREDLLDRLQVLPIRMPSLRERREDIAELAEALVARTCTRYKLAPLRLSFAATGALQGHDWPGNVRDLSNRIEAGALRAHAQGFEEIHRHHLFSAAPEGDHETEELTLDAVAREAKRQLLCRMLEETRWNVAETARRLGAARSHINNLIQAYGLQRQRA